MCVSRRPEGRLDEMCLKDTRVAVTTDAAIANGMTAFTFRRAVGMQYGPRVLACHLRPGRRNTLLKEPAGFITFQYSSNFTGESKCIDTSLQE